MPHIKKGTTFGRLGQGVAAIHPQVRAGDVLGGITEQEGNGAHEILRRSHLTGGDQGDPLVPQFRVLLEDLAGPGRQPLARSSIASKTHTYKAVSMYPGLMQFTRMS